jgi:phage recombination protein Bet
MEARERLFDRERMATRFGGSKCEYCEKDIPEGAQIAYRRGEAPIHWDCWVEIVAKDHPQAMNDGALGPKDKVTDIAPTGPSPVLMPQSELDEITATVKASILPPDATDAELRLYLEICKSYHVHPLMRRMYAFRDPKGKLVVGVTIDGFLEIAERTGELVGFGETKFDYQEDQLTRATVYVYRKGWEHPVSVSARYSEYARNADKEWSPWRKMPEVMLEKVALARTLRRAFPATLGGIYTREELEGAQ